jgi:hypothetical protein
MGQGRESKDEGRRMNQEVWCICFVAFIGKVFFGLPDSHSILPEWGRISIRVAG